MLLKSRILAYAQLLRVPNVFTAFADICLGGAVSGLISAQPLRFVAVMLSSGCLYLAGMAWNDYFDRHEDARDRPFRPIPSGRVSARSAILVGIALMLAGLGFAALASDPATLTPALFSGQSPTPLLIALLLVLAIFGYDGGLKQNPAGPLGMGLCRFLNVLLGFAAAGAISQEQPLPWHLAGTVGLYIVGVTWFARTEETRSNRWSLVAASVVMAVSLALGLLVPIHFPAGSSPWYFPYLILVFGIVLGQSIQQAIRLRTPASVQAAVKRSILGLVVLDAFLAVAVVGWPGLGILLLLIPARILGRWVYLT